MPSTNRTELTKIKKTVNEDLTRRAAVLREIANKICVRDEIEKLNNMILFGRKQSIVKTTSIFTTSNNNIVEKSSTETSKPIITNDIVSRAANVEEKIITEEESNEDNKNVVEDENVNKEIINKEPVVTPVNIKAIWRKDVYNYWREIEKKHTIKKGFLNDREVTPDMRSVVVDSLIEDHKEFVIIVDILYHSVATMDRFLELHETIRSIEQLRLLAELAIFFVCENLEDDFEHDTFKFPDCDIEEVTEMKNMLLHMTRDHSIMQRSPFWFLTRYREMSQALSEHFTMAMYFIEESMLHYELCHYPPSLMAAASLYLSIFVIGFDDEQDGPIWNEDLVRYTDYDKKDFMPIVYELIIVIVEAENSKYQAVRRKFSELRYGKMSLHPKLKSPTMLAAAKMCKDNDWQNMSSFFPS